MSNHLLTPWRNWYPGIDHAAGLSTVAFDRSIVREQNVHAIRIDLSTPGLAFYTTPHSGDYHTRNATIFDFLKAANKACGVRLAINAALAAAQSGDVGAAASLFGLAKSQGKVVCDPTVAAPQPTTPPLPPPGKPPADVPDASHTGTVALLLTQDNQARFAVINAETPGEAYPWSSTYTAVAGSPQPQPASDGWPPQPFVGGLLKGEAMVLRGGQNNGIPSPEGTGGEKVAGRTAVGLSKDRRTLFLLTIDGVEGADPQYGAIFHDVGEWLLLLGAHDGITLDGGGSTAMAMLNRRDEPVLVNIPHGTEGPPYIQRANAQFFGVVPGSTIV
jgi:hypothetical protein